MRKLFYTLLVASIIFTNQSFANHEKNSSDVIGHRKHSNMSKADRQKTVSRVKNADHTIIVQVDGLVCDFCARALEKLFGKRSEVSGIDVNLDTKLVTIGLKQNADMGDATITQLIMDAGYNVVKINR